MAIDPSISLGFRPPQIAPLQLQTPLDRYQKMLTLRSLMDQQQYRQLQAQQTQQEIATAQQEAARDAEFRRRMATGQTPTAGETYGMLGATKGGAFLSQQAELETKKETRALNNLRLIGQAAFSAKDQRDRDFKIKLLVSGGAIPQEMADEFLKQPFDLAETQAFGQQLMTIAEQKHAEIEAKTRAHAERMEPFQERTAAANARAAEQTAAGTTPLTEYQRAQLKQQEVPNNAQEIIIWRNQPGRTQAEVAWADNAIKALTEYAAVARPAPVPLQPVSPEREAQDVRKAVTISTRTGEAAAERAPATEAENRSLGFYDRSASADKTLESVKDYIKTKSTAGLWAIQNAPNAALSKNDQAYLQGARQFINAYLRRDSGAVIGPTEWDDAYRTFLPYPGDDPETLALKARERKVIIEGLKTSAGRAYSRKYGEPDATKQGATPPASGMPTGTEIDINGKRYRYKGSGATDDLANYTEVKP